MPVKPVNNNMLIKNILLALLVVALTIIPLYIAPFGSEFGGADGEAVEAIAEIQKDYVPWYSPIFEPPSGEIESLLFVVQAAIGAGIIGYGLGFMKGRVRKDETV